MKVEKNPFSQLLIMTVVSMFLLLTPCGAERKHRNFQIAVVRNLIENVGSFTFSPSPIGDQLQEK
jgi:hypothetical protein